MLEAPPVDYPLPTSTLPPPSIPPPIPVVKIRQIMAPTPVRGKISNKFSPQRPPIHPHFYSTPQTMESRIHGEGGNKQTLMRGMRSLSQGEGRGDIPPRGVMVFHQCVNIHWTGVTGGYQQKINSPFTSSFHHRRHRVKLEEEKKRQLTKLMDPDSTSIVAKYIGYCFCSC